MGASGSDPTERKFTGLSKAQRPGRHNTAVEEDSVYSGGNGSRKATERTYSTSLLARVDENAIMCEHRSASSKIFTRFSRRNASGNGRRKFALCTWSWWAFFCIHVHVLRAVTQGKFWIWHSSFIWNSSVYSDIWWFFSCRGTFDYLKWLSKRVSLPEMALDFGVICDGVEFWYLYIYIFFLYFTHF